MPVLYLVVCGGQPADSLTDLVRALLGDGWDVCVITTPDGAKFVDVALLAELTGHPVRDTYKRPEDPDVLPSADVFAVAPATFNTINKWAAGISDTLALGLLNEALGLDVPILAVPWANAALASHPAYGRSLGLLSGVGVRLISTDAPEFPWEALRAELDGVKRTLVR
jgi:phosphopantothenoylcysteine synthetase/decarboxylase